MFTPAANGGHDEICHDEQQEELMPFDGTPVGRAKVRLLALWADLLAFGSAPPEDDTVGPRPMPAWHRCRQRESLGDTLAVLGRARQLVQDEARWCCGSFAHA
jgi:hypothetical protein